MLPTGCWLDVRLERKVPVRRERDPRAVGRPGRPERPVQRACVRRTCWRPPTCQVARLPGVQIKNPDIGGVRTTRRDKRDVTAVGRHRRLVVQIRIVRQTLETRAIRTDTIDIRLTRTGAFGRKDDPLAVRRKGRVVVEAGGAKQRPLACTVCVGDIQNHLRWSQPVHEKGLRRRSQRREGHGATQCHEEDNSRFHWGSPSRRRVSQNMGSLNLRRRWRYCVTGSDVRLQSSRRGIR